MEFILSILYLYVIIYTIYFFILSIRNLNDRPFYIEKKYSKYDGGKKNFAVIIYNHNHKDCLEELVEQIKMQDYPLANFRVYAILDDCNDGSEKLFEHDNFVHVMNIQDVGTLGKNKAVSMLLDELKKDPTIDAYIFIDGIRKIESDFLTLANTALTNADAVTGELEINRESLDIVDKIKAVHKKYHANFFKQARSLLGLATQIDSGLFIIKRDVLDEINGINFKDINSELEFSLLLSQTGHKCVYNPNIQSYILGQDCLFKKPRLTKRFNLFKTNFKNLKTINFAFLEHFCSLLNPNFWALAAIYTLLITYSYSYQFLVPCNVVIFSAILLLAVFGISLVNSKLDIQETLLLMTYPIYSMCHIIKNFPPVRYLLQKIGAGSDKETDKLSIDVLVQTKHGDRGCKLEFISTESGLSKIRFIYKNKKYTTSTHLRMIDALQQLKSKMEDYGLILKICSCCKNFTSCIDGSTNMLKGQCHNEFPSPLLNEPRPTLIWNSCSSFEPAQINSIIEEMAQEVENQEN
ncbi:glycosyltransferase family 2 protein [bacterium]|nr:glycosyltransferase family 2 protein [bacterium]MBO5446666.1 glycosyltransferase family 2 protein [bacterium]